MTPEQQEFEEGKMALAALQPCSCRDFVEIYEKKRKACKSLRKPGNLPEKKITPANKPEGEAR